MRSGVRLASASRAPICVGRLLGDNRAIDCSPTVPAKVSERGPEGARQLCLVEALTGPRGQLREMLDKEGRVAKGCP